MPFRTFQPIAPPKRENKTTSAINQHYNEPMQNPVQFKGLKTLLSHFAGTKKITDEVVAHRLKIHDAGFIFSNMKAKLISPEQLENALNQHRKYLEKNGFNVSLYDYLLKEHKPQIPID